MTLKKDATQADVDKLKAQTGKVVELGADKAERSGAASLRKYPDEATTTGSTTGTTTTDGTKTGQ